MKISARNQLKATITKITAGAVNTEVQLDMGGQSVTAVITNASAQSLGLAVGKPAYAIIKASSIMVGVD